MTRKSYTNAEKKEILIRAMAIGVGKAAKEYDMSYQTLLNWWKKKEEFLGDQSVSGSDTDEKIQYVQAEIDDLNEAIKAKKAELKELLKQKAKEAREEAKRKEKEAKAEAERKVEEEKKQLLNALMDSGKSIDEIMAFLNAGE